MRDDAGLRLALRLGRLGSVEVAEIIALVPERSRSLVGELADDPVVELGEFRPLIPSDRLAHVVAWLMVALGEVGGPGVVAPVGLATTVDRVVIAETVATAARVASAMVATTRAMRPSSLRRS